MCYDWQLWLATIQKWFIFSIWDILKEEGTGQRVNLYHMCAGVLPGRTHSLRLFDGLDGPEMKDDWSLLWLEANPSLPLSPSVSPPTGRIIPAERIRQRQLELMPSQVINCCVETCWWTGTAQIQMSPMWNLDLTGGFISSPFDYIFHIKFPQKLYLNQRHNNVKLCTFQACQRGDESR